MSEVKMSEYYKRGNVIKYVCRAGFKSHNIGKYCEDLYKAWDYISFTLRDVKKATVSNGR